MPKSVPPSAWPAHSSEMAGRIREHDWAATPLGSPQRWPSSLKTLVDVMLAANQPMFVAWGSERTVIHNDAYAQILTAKHPAALGRDVLDVWHEIRDDLVPIIERAYEGVPGQMDDVTPLMVRKGYTEEARFTLSFTPVRDETGTIAGVFCACQAITGEALTERRMQESEARLATIFASASVGLSELALDGRFLQVNDELCRILGRSREEVLSLSIADVTHPEDVPPSFAAVAQVIESGEPAELDKRYRRPDGSMVWANSRISLPRHGGGEPATLLAVTVDLTARRLAEAAVRKSEERLRAILETARDYAVLTADADGRIETWSRGAEEVLGWSAEEIIGHSMDIIFTPEDRAKGVPEQERRTAREEGHAPDVRWHRCRNGSRVFINGVTWPLTGPDGSLSGFLKVGQDATGRRRTEERLQLATDAASLGIFDADLTTGEIDWDARMRELWGVGPDAVITDERFLAGIHPEDIEMAQAAIGLALDPEGDHLYQAEYRTRQRENGRECWIAARGQVHFDGPRPVRLVGTVQDISERKRAEAALRESEARFRQFGDASADALWVRDAESLTFEYLSPAVEELYGTRIENFLKGNHVRRWAETIVPEDREAVFSNLRRVRQGEHVLQAFRILRSDGVVRWIRDTSFPLLDEDGRVQRIGGIAHDATEELEFQDRLKVLVAELQHRSRNLMGVVQRVTERTLSTSETLEDFRDRFRARLGALARVNSLLSRLEDGDRITFDQLIQSELQAHGVIGFDGRGEQATLQGPKGIRLRSATLQTFALALHELATNALKHGALSRPEGRLEVKWSLVPGRAGEQRLRLDWRESGAHLAQPDGELTMAVNGTSAPRRQGYGREFIERALPYQLKAETTYQLTPEGVRCTIIVPVSSTLEVALSVSGHQEG